MLIGAGCDCILRQLSNRAYGPYGSYMSYGAPFPSSWRGLGGGLSLLHFTASSGAAARVVVRTATAGAWVRRFQVVPSRLW